jgi:hypothetical protein
MGLNGSPDGARYACTGTERAVVRYDTTGIKTTSVASDSPIRATDTRGGSGIGSQPHRT